MTAPARISPAALDAPHRLALSASSTTRERLRLGLRRAAVVAGVALSIVVGALTTQSAAEWTAATAPLNAPPVSADQVAAQLSAEQTRAAALDQQVADLTAQSQQLAVALQTAQGQMATDGKTAAALRAKLKAAQTRLATVQKALKAASVAAARAASRPPAAPPARPAPAPFPGDD